MINKVTKMLLAVFFIFLSIPIFATEAATDSPYRRAGNFIFISTQIPFNPATQKMVSSDMNLQVKQVLDNLRGQVIAAGAEMKDVIKITVYMDDIEAIFPIVKKNLPLYFSDPYPARSPIGGVSFGRHAGFNVAMDAIVFKP